MRIDHDTGDSLAAAAWLANSAATPDGLSGPDDLRQFISQHAYTGRRDDDQAEVDSIRAIRGELRELLLVERNQAHLIINPLLQRAQAVPQLAKHDPRDWHYHAVTQEAPLAERILVETALAMGSVVIADETSRIGTCQAANCDNVVVDLTRNRSRKFCSTTCANRVAVAAYRARKQ